MRSSKRRLFSFLADWAIRLTGDRRDSEQIQSDIRRADYRTDTGGMGVRMTSSLRDRLRRGWLRIRRGD